MLQSEPFHGIVVDRPGLFGEFVTDGFVEKARGVDGRTVRKVAAVCEVESHEGVSRLEYGEKDGHIGLSSRVRLYVGILGAEQFAEPIYSQLFHLVYDLAAAVITCAGIALGVFVGQYRAHSLHHLVAHEVLRNDQQGTLHLALFFLFDQIEKFGVFSHCR